MTAAGHDGAPRLPRDVESDPRGAAVRSALGADRRPLWSSGVLHVAVVPWDDDLRTVLADLAGRGRLVRGLEAADRALESERRGHDALPEAVAARQGERVSRLALVTSDGATRFYRQVERLAVAHAPRLLVCRVEATSEDVGAALYGPGEVAKLVLTGHKTATSALLFALASAAPPLKL